MPYYVSYSQCTPDEPSPGWYYSREDEEGETTILGPFVSKRDALDSESNGAYSDWLASKADEGRDLGTYREQMRDAGRGHLLRDDD